jgi:outer membrane immunogenic protein
MRKLALVFASAALMTASAQAADLRPMAKAPPRMAAVPAPMFSWTGFYIGANAGYAWTRTDIDYYLPDPIFFNSRRHEDGGFIGGAQIGYNWQAGMLVFGVEIDAAYRNARERSTFAFANGLDFTDFDTEQHFLATFRPRLGIAANNLLFYVTGGAALGGVDYSYTERRPSVAGASRTITLDETRLGWTAGGGIEAGFGQWSFGVEYLYVDLGNERFGVGPAVLGGVGFPASSVDFDERSHIVRGKLNYRFGWAPAAPVMARY